MELKDWNGRVGFIDFTIKPKTPHKNSLWFNNETKELFMFDGNEWIKQEEATV